MPELTIKYKNKRTLQALMDFSKYFDFSIVLPKNKLPNESIIKGVTIIPADSSIDTTEMESVFSKRKLDPKQLRKESWQRIR